MIRGQQRGAAKARDRNEQGGTRNSEKARQACSPCWEHGVRRGTGPDRTELLSPGQEFGLILGVMETTVKF